MKTAIRVLVAIVVAFTFLFCTKEQTNDQSLPQNITSDAIISPDGIVLAESEQALKEVIQKDIDRIAGETVDFNIDFYEFFENENLSAVSVYFTTSSQIKSNVVFVKRRLSKRNSDGAQYTVSCHECEGCGVSTTDEADGTFTYSCWVACCEMTISE